MTTSGSIRLQRRQRRSPRLQQLQRLAVVLVALAVPTGAAAIDPIYSSGLFSSVAISGADPVGYFTESRHVEGKDQFAAEWNGATWHFATAANRDAFLADPERYAPAYGGYCAYAVAHGSTASTDPEAWAIVDGTLYLNYSKSIQKKWDKDRSGFIAQADANWPDLLAGD